MSDWSVEKMLEIGRLHARLEAERRLEPLMDTLVPDAVYEFHPVGLTLQGSANVRRYYEQLLGRFMTWVRGYELLDEWANDHSVAQEYDIQLQVDGARPTGWSASSSNSPGRSSSAASASTAASGSCG